MTLYVQKAPLYAYETIPPWSGFGAIVRISGTVRIHAASDCDTSGKGGVCGLYGSKRHTPAKCVNILRMANGKTHKVMAGCDMPR